VKKGESNHNWSFEVLEMTRQETETPASRNWEWVEASIWTERMLAALENGVKGGKWFSLIDKVYALSTLQAAWRQVARNRGAAGIDGESIKRFRSKERQYLEELSQSIQEGSYQPDAIRRVYIPKGDGKQRPLGIPTVKDRIVQTALKMVVEPIFEKEFVSNSYGFRPNRGAKDALREVAKSLKSGYEYVVDADLQSYFDTIPHQQLMALIEEKISDSRVLCLINAFLEQAIMEGMQSWTPVSGTPQGGVLSPVLSNVYLHGLDVLMAQGNFRMIRYADDFVVMCRSLEEAQSALEKIQQWTEANGLKLHPEKTRLVSTQEDGASFEFLGYRFQNGKRWVRRKSLQKFREAIRVKTKRNNGRGLQTTIEELNPLLKGWFAYFKHAHRRTFEDMDGFIRRRLRAMLRKQQKRPGFGANHNDHKQWPNSFFAQQGLFSLYTARLIASQPR
jgi:RNA-directed DNA polymerase